MTTRRTVLVTFGMLLAGLAVPNAEGDPRPKAAPEARQGPPVLESKGYIVAMRTVQIVPEQRGRVVALNVEEGSIVRKGALLARLDRTLQEIELRRASAVLQQARARLKAAEAAAAGVGAKDETPLKETIEVARCAVAIAEADVDRAKYLLDARAVRAPCDGTVLAKKVEAGGSVDPAGFNLAASICEMADLSQLEVELQIQDRDLHLVYVGQRCEIQPEAFPDQTYQGRVTRLGPVADRAKGAVVVRVRIRVPPGDRRLCPEMGAVVKFLGKGDGR